MHVTLITVGSRGDVQPFVALGVGLRRAGHTVRLATHGIFRSLAEAQGLEFAALEGNPAAITQGAEGQAWLESERNPIQFVRGFQKLMGPIMAQAMRDAWALCQGTEAIISSGTGFFVAYSIAERLRVPFLQAYLQPVHPTRAFPSSLFPTPFRGGGWFNYLSHIIGGQGFWQVMRPAINATRRDLLDLPPLPPAGPFLDLERAKMPIVYGYSPAVLPKPKDWGDWVHVVGYWLLEQPNWTPPPALADFLAAGPPPVYIGFGSMSDRDPARMTEVVLGALRRAGQRGLLATGWGGLSQSDLPDEVFKLEQAPHDWLFRRVAAVVHHGGAGTTAAGLHAGVPSLLIPFFGDQPFWADRLEVLGVGRQLARRTLTAENLGLALREATAHGSLRARAAALGAQIRTERGIARTIEIFEREARSVGS